MFRKLVVAGIAMAAAGALTGAQADDGNLVRITEQRVDLDGTRKTSIDVSKTRGAYNGIRVRARSGEVDVTCVQVVYSNGTIYNEDRLIHLLQGERSRPINSRKDGHHIDQVNIVTKGSSGKALIEVLGIQSGASAASERKPSVVPSGDTGCYGAVEISKAAAKAAEESSADKAEKHQDSHEKKDGVAIPVTPTSPQATTATPGQALESGDVLFGAQRVGFLVDRDVIRVGQEIGKFDRVRLRVLDNDIHINEAKVIYINGEPDVLAVNADLKQNTKTVWLPLKGDRFIKEIQLNYRSKPSIKGEARIEVFGQYADGWLGKDGEGRKYNQGWVLLGAQPAGFVGLDTEVIPVGRNEGGFSKIRVTVKDRAITLNELRVIYASGAEDVIPVKAKVDAGTTYGPVDLKGGERAIKEVRARVRSRFFDKDAKGKGAAIVEIWGKR